MAKTNARRILSILLCVAMVASLFTVSFTASAAETGVTDDGDITYYDWDFTDTNAGKDYYEETKDYSYRINTWTNLSDDIFKYNEDAPAYEIVSDTNNDSTRGVILKTPEGKLAYTMSFETYSAADYWNYNPHAIAIIAEDENGYYGIKAQANDMARDFLYKLYYFQKEFNTDGTVKKITKKADRQAALYIAAVNGEEVALTGSDAASVEKLTGGVLNFSFNNRDLSMYSWKYDVNVVDETDIVVTVTITYTGDAGDYVFVSQDLTFNVDYFTKDNETFAADLAKIGATVTHAKFKPVLGFANSQGRGILKQGDAEINYNCLVSNVHASFKTTEKCAHEDTVLINDEPATCEEEGYSGDTYCNDCETTIAYGSVVDPLGHDYKTERVEPQIGVEGLITRTCSRCGDVQKETIPALEAYTVTFLDDDGEVFYEEEVGEGYAANGPDTIPDSNEGWTFIGWDTSYSKVVSNLTIRPVFYDTEAEVKSYTFDFENPDTAKSDLVKFKYLTKMTTGNSTDYIDEELGGMVIPFRTTWGNGASVLWNAKDSSMKSFYIKGSAPDAHWNSTHTPGVVFASDEGGVFVYKIEAGEYNGFTRKVYYMPYNTQKTGFSGAWSLLTAGTGSSTIIAVNDSQLETPATNIQQAALAVGLEIDVKTANQNQRYFTYEYTGEVLSDGLHINTVAVYDDGNVQAAFTMQEEVFSLQGFIDNAENYFEAGRSDKKADLSFYNAINREENPILHEEFDWVFGLYDYAGNNPAGFGLTGICLINNINVEYENYEADEESCKHDPRSRTTSGAIAASCGKAGYTGEIICGYCGKVLEAGSEIPALEHNYIVTSIKEPTADTEGEILYTCSNCGDTKTEKIPIRKLSYTSYKWDFSDVENADNNIADMRAVSTTYAWWTVWDDDAYDGIYNGEQRTFGHGYDSERGVYYMKQDGLKALNIMSFANPGDYEANKLVAEGGTYDADTSINNNFAVVIGRDTNGVYVYYVYINNEKQICRELRYIEFMIYDGKEAGVYSPVNDTAQCPVVTGLCSNLAAQSSDTLVAAYLDGATVADAVSNVNAQFPVFIKNKAAFKYKYTVDVSYLGTISVNCEITYDDGASSYKWTTLTETYDIQNFAKLAEGNSDYANFNKVEHKETEVSFGIAMMCPGVANQVYRCGVNGVTATYAKETTCEHLNGTKLVDDKPATCTEKGYTGDYVCVDCGAIITKGSVIAAKGHTKSGAATETVEATCSTEGYSVYTCSVCNNPFHDDIVPATGKHTPAEERKNVKPATCTEKGYTGDVVCKDCETVITKGEEIAAKGHTPDGAGKVTAATCTEDGYTTYHCSVCNTDYTVAGDKALGHDYQWVTTKEATETEDGLEEHKCTRCGDVDDTKVIPATSSDVKYGDANGDGIINIDDAIAVLRHNSELDTIEGVNFKAADVDGNGNLEVADAIYILSYNAELIDKFPVEEKIN